MPKNKPPVFPKFIHYSAHAETLSVFLEGLGLHNATRLEPGSALFIEFFSLEDKVHRFKEFKVRFIIKEHEREERVL